MAKGELYNIILDPSMDQTGDIHTYMVFKYDSKTLIERDKPYRVRRGPGIFGCNCWAGSKPTCRHRDMVEIFIDDNLINSNRLYNYDEGKWSEDVVPSMGGDDGDL